jgi:hypothetical protein
VGAPLAAMFDNPGRVVLGVLAVAGGFLVGNLLTLILCRLVAKAAFHTRMNHRLEQALRILGGIALAVLVAWLVFRGGPGWGFGGTGSGEGEGAGGPSPKDTDPSKEARPKVVPKKDEEAILASGVKVTVLRGSAYPKTFRFEGEAEGMDLAAAKEKLRHRKEASMGKLQFMDLLIYRNSTAEGNLLIQDFEEYAHGLGLRTSRQKLDQSLPE